MSDFPLYNMLISNCENKGLSVDQKKKTIDELKKMETKHIELVYLLIYFYSKSFKEEEILTKLCEYEENKDGTCNLSFDLNKLPNLLGQLILNFIEKNKNTDQDK